MKVLRQVRESRGFTQEQLAVKAGLTAATVGNLENGKSLGHFSTLKVLQIALGFEGEPDQLLEDADEPSPISRVS